MPHDFAVAGGEALGAQARDGGRRARLAARSHVDLRAAPRQLLHGRVADAAAAEKKTGLGRRGTRQHLMSARAVGPGGGVCSVLHALTFRR